MLVYSKILKNSIWKCFLVFVFIIIYSGVNAQNDTIPHFYKDSTGNLFILKGTPVNFYIGTSNKPNESIRLKRTSNENEPIHWSGHGPKHLTYYNLYLGRRINFDLFTDALPPQTDIIFDSRKGYKLENTIFLSGTCRIDLNAVDPDAGLKGVYYSINDGANIRYFEPIVLKSEGEYKLTAFALDNVGNKEEEIVKTIVVDNTPPLTRLEFEGDNFENVVSGRSKLNFLSIDALGVKQTLYSIDNGNFTTYSKLIETLTLLEGDHTITWYSIDYVDNVEEKRSCTIFVDKTPPMVFEEVVGSTYMVAGTEFSSGRSQLKIAAVDNKSGVKEIKYSLNGSEYKKYEKPVYLSDLLGTVSIRSFAVDQVNNRSQSDIQSQAFSMPTVDITGPQIHFSFKGPRILISDTTWIGPKTNINIISNDIGSGVNRITYKIKGDLEQEYKAPFVVESEGYHEIGFTAFDNVDNVNLLSFGFGVDSKPPSIFYHFGSEPIKWLLDEGDRIPVYSKGVRLFLAATDNISGIDKIYYSINNEPELLYRMQIESFKPGLINLLRIKAVDLLGNQTELLIKFRVE